MPPVSALSAALAQPDLVDDNSKTTVNTASWEALHRNVAFPCLRHARQDDVRVLEITEGYDQLDITKQSFPGTSVTKSMQGSLVRLSGFVS